MQDGNCGILFLIILLGGNQLKITDVEPYVLLATLFDATEYNCTGMTSRNLFATVVRKSYSTVKNWALGISKIKCAPHIIHTYIQKSGIEPKDIVRNLAANKKLAKVETQYFTSSQPSDVLDQIAHLICGDVGYIQSAVREDAGAAAIEEQTGEHSSKVLTPDEMYQKGEDAYKAKNFIAAIEWLQAAAAHDHAEAQCTLAMCFRFGIGVGKDVKRAFELFMRAANQDLPVAQYELARCYEKGVGCEASLSKSIRHLRRSAQNGFTDAQYYLGHKYMTGCGVSQSFQKGFKLIHEAAIHEHPLAQYELGKCYEKGISIPCNYGLASEWYRSSAELGCAKAQYALGLCYEKGMGVEKNIAEAVRWYQAAAEQRHKHAMRKIRKIDFS